MLTPNLTALPAFAAGLLLVAAGLANAATGKLLLAGGVSSVDGAAGGGITPWAMTGSNATEGEVGVSAFLTRARTSYAELQIRRADFHALVVVLQQSMDARGIPFATQNRLLALLAPMHREIITR